MTTDDDAQFPGLEIDEAMHVQGRIWTIQRASWVGLLVIVLAALAGLVGPGPLSSTEMALSGGRMSVRFDRFAHFETRTELRVSMQPQSGDKATIWISNDYLECVAVERVFPEPESAAYVRGGVRYEFTVDRLNSTEGKPYASFAVKPTKIGTLRGRIGADPDGATSFRQFVYP